MQRTKQKYYTPEEYLALEEKAEFKSEYDQGEIFAFSGASLNHNQIIQNVCSRINQQRKKHNCRVFANDLRLWIEANQLFTYPDIMIICDKPKFYSDRDDTVVNPNIIVEILSESTKNYERGDKFVFYRSIPSFQEYILIDQYSAYVEQFNISAAGKWQLTEYKNVKEHLTLTKIDFQIPLEEIYADVEFK